MPEVCGEPHPDQPEITCDKPRPCFLNHMGGGQVWLGEPDPREGTRHRGRTRKQTLAEMSGRVPQSTTAGEPILAIQPSHGSGSFTGKVKDPAWVSNAITVFRDFLGERFNRTFTTPEDLWPLLDAPQEMREMVRVVQHALAEDWIEETGAKRLKGTYRTRDGVEFKMNKLVPVYLSKVIVLHIVESIEEDPRVTALQDFG